jgi:MYXO-CTERM domain-containing protein
MGEGTGTVGLGPYVPGYAFFHIVVPAGQRQVRASFTAAGGGFMGGTIEPYVLFRKGADRLSFSYVGATVRDNSDLAVAATSLDSDQYEAVYCEAAGELEAGDYWVMIANTGSSQMQMQAISVRYNDSIPDATCVGGDPDAGDGGTDVPEDVLPADAADDGAGDAPPGSCDPAACEASCRSLGQAGGSCQGEGADIQCVCSNDDDGCGCRAAGGSARPVALLGLLGLGMLLALRRSRRR